MPVQIVILEAEMADVSALVRIQWDSMECDVLTSFLYGSQRDIAIQKHGESLGSTLEKRLTHPTNECHIHKAVSAETGEILGWSLVRWEDGKVVVPPEPEAANFRPHYVREVMRACLEICEGQRHVMLGGLYIDPASQGRGIGTRLIENIYKLYNLDREPVIVQTRARTENFYAKLGWETVACAELDLSRFAGAGQGYGVHRSPQMLRDPNNVLAKRKNSRG